MGKEQKREKLREEQSKDSVTAAAEEAKHLERPLRTGAKGFNACSGSLCHPCSQVSHGEERACLSVCTTKSPLEQTALGF